MLRYKMLNMNGVNVATLELNDEQEKMLEQTALDMGLDKIDVLCWAFNYEYVIDQE